MKMQLTQNKTVSLNKPDTGNSGVSYYNNRVNAVVEIGKFIEESYDAN